MWEKIESSDIEQAKHNLTLRRAETLSRHADEMRALDAEESDVDELASAIARFMAKFGQSAESVDKAAPASTADLPAQNSPQADNPEVQAHNTEVGGEPVVQMGVNFRRYG